MLCEGQWERCVLKSQSICDHYHVWDSFKDSLALCWPSSIHDQHYTAAEHESEAILKTQQSHYVPDRGVFTWQSLTLPGLLNKFLLAQLSFFSETAVPFDTDLTAVQRTACTGIQKSQCVKGRGVSDRDPGITGASALWPCFGLKLYSLILWLSPTFLWGHKY